MCLPAALAAVGAAVSGGAATGAAAVSLGAATTMGVASTALQIRGQQQAAKAQATVQKRATEQEQKRYLAEVQSMRVQQAQEAIARSQQITEAGRRAKQARATTRVTAGESGISGISLDNLINNITKQEAEYKFATEQQRQIIDTGREIQFRNVGLSSRMNLLRINQPIEKPNYAGAVVSGIQTGLSTYSAVSDMQGG